MSLQHDVGTSLPHHSLRLDRFLFYVAAARGDVPSTLKGLGRCLDVFVRYPGLCRSVMGWVVHTCLCGVLLSDVSANLLTVDGRFQILSHWIANTFAYVLLGSSSRR